MINLPKLASLPKPFEPYQADADGNIYNGNGKLIKTIKRKDGYCVVNMRIDIGAGEKKSIQCYVHRLVWLAFYGPSYELDHINRDKSDNRIENLRAVTHSENLKNRAPFRWSDEARLRNKNKKTISQ